MTDTSSTYDELPYSDRAFVLAHPDRLAVVGALYGVSAARVDDCAVLELGCGLGGNLMPMAAMLEGSRFVGIDLSARQIDQGRAVIEKLGLDNVELRRQDLMDFDAGEGPFDYILCHGVYSWVPPAVGDRILEICGQCLSPNGLAIISYNTYPGWRSNQAVRDILRYGARGAVGSGEQVAQAMEYLSFIARNVFDGESPYGRVVKEAAERLAGENPTYVFHEYLEECNFPVSFEDFVARASQADLRFVGDCGLYDPSNLLSDESRSALTAVADDVVRCEGMLDFLRNRRFRRDVLCRGDVATERWPSPAALAGMLLSCQAKPVSTKPSTKPGEVEEFRSQAGRSLSTAEPALKQALLTLHRAKPRALPYAEMLAKVRASVANLDEDSLARSLLVCAMGELVGLHTHLPAIDAKPSGRPLASVVARWQAAEGKLVVDPAHRSVQLDDLSAGVLSLLDGKRDRRALCDAVTERLRAGELKIAARLDGGRGASKGAVREVVDDVLRGLAGLGLLLDRPGGGE